MLFNAATWPTIIESPTEARDRAHRVAFYEGRRAAKQESRRAATTAPHSLLDRVRAAIGIAPSAPDAVACGAC